MLLFAAACAAAAVAGPSPLELGSLAIHLPNGIDVHCETALVSAAPQPARGGVTRRFGFADVGDGCETAAMINDRDVHSLMVLPRGTCLLHEQSRRLLSAAGEVVIIVSPTHDLRADAAAAAADDARAFERAGGAADARALVRPAVLVSNSTGALIRAHVAAFGPQLLGTIRPPAPMPCEPELLAAHWVGWTLALLSATAALGAMGRRALRREPSSSSSYELLARRTAPAAPARWRECEAAARLALLAAPCADGLGLLSTARALATGGVEAAAAARDGRHGALLAYANAHAESAASRAELALLALGAGAQLVGCACVVAAGARRPWRVRQGCALLLGWLAAHPLLYGHVHDAQLLATTASILGGLLLLVPAAAPADERARGARAHGARALERACARLLATTVLAHCAARPLLERLATGHSAADPLARTLAEAKVAAGTAVLCAHAALGFESRRNALVLVCVLVCANLALRPLWPAGARPGGPEPFAHTPDGLVDLAARADAARFLYARSLAAAGALALFAVHARADGPPAGTLPVLADKSHER